MSLSLFLFIAAFLLNISAFLFYVRAKRTSTQEMREINEQIYKKNVALADVSKNLAEANEKLKQLDRLKDEFVSLASHELRTPMTAIKSYLWLFLQYNKTQLGLKENLYIERAYESTDRLITLVNDMLDVSRIESGRLTITMQSVDMTQLAREVIEELSPTAQKGKIEVLLAPPKEPLPHVNADKNKIREVLVNLVGNALKFTDPGGKVTIQIYQDGDTLFTKITDTGKGISAEDIPKLFQKFGPINANPLQKNTEGTGLGLYISKSIITLHGGELHAESEGENKGATFVFSLKIDADKTKLNAQTEKPQQLLTGK